MLHQPADASFAVPPGHSSTNLFIKHIPESVTDELLEQAMRVFGQLESKKVIRDIHTGRSQEKAFARFTTHEEAERAMRHMVQHGLFGVMPRVEWAQQRYDETITDATRQQRKKLFMRNIPNDVTEEQVRHLVEQYGPVEHVTLRDDTQPSRAVTPPCSATPTPASNLQIAFVVYANEGCAAIACDKLYQTYPFPSCGSTPIMTKLAETKKERAVRRDPPRGANRGAAGGNRRNGQRPSATCSGASSLTDYRGGALAATGCPIWTASARTHTASSCAARSSTRPRSSLPRARSTSTTCPVRPALGRRRKTSGTAAARWLSV
eukprot:gene751-biopygen588